MLNDVSLLVVVCRIFVCVLNPDLRVNRRFSGDLASLGLKAIFAVAWIEIYFASSLANTLVWSGSAPDILRYTGKVEGSCENFYIRRKSRRYASPH